MSISPSRDIYSVVQNIRSLFNVGALFRCADVFGVKKIYLCGYTGFPPRKEISKTALGADNYVAWERHWQTHLLLKKLSAAGVRIVALETGKKTISLPDYQPRFPIAVVVGSETRGITKSVLKLANDVVSIPMSGRKESLNVATAAAIALYSFRS